MNTLVLDTATHTEMAAVRIGSCDTHEIYRADISHSVALFERIDRALKSAHASIKDIELIAVGIGPGSFTGIRIAVTTARMLAQTLNVPLIGIPTTELFAVSADANTDQDIVVAFDAKKSRVFGARYKNAPEGLVCITEPG